MKSLGILPEIYLPFSFALNSVLFGNILLLILILKVKNWAAG